MHSPTQTMLGTSQLSILGLTQRRLNKDGYLKQAVCIVREYLS